MADEAELQITIIPDEEANVANANQTVEVKKDTVQAEVKDPAMLELMSQYKELETNSAEKQRKADERIRVEVEARQAAEREAESAKKSQTNSHLDTITTAISASEQDIEGAKAAIRSAKSSGDIEAEIEAQDRLAKARATQLRLDEAKQDIEARIKAPPPKREQPASVDPVEAFARTRTQETADWIRAHPEYVKSDRGIRKLTAADAVAQDEGLVPDTKEYFARVEKYLGIGESETAAAPKVAPTEASQVLTKPRSGAPPVAPGASVSGNGGGVPSVSLTAREAAAAQDGTLVWNYPDPSGKNRWKKGDPIGLQEMGRRKMQGTKQGLYDRSFTEG